MSAIVWIGLIIISLVSQCQSQSQLSARKCADYQKICSTNESALVIEGERAAPKEFPYMALIGYDKNDEIVWLCSGTLVSESFVLTAAHCVKITNYGHSKYVLLGELDRAKEDDDAQPLRLEITEHIIYPTYTTRSKSDDIALLKLATAIQFSDYIQSACLSGSGSPVGPRALVTGWGSVKYQGDYETHLQKIAMNLISHEQCNEAYSAYFEDGIDQRKKICAVTGANERDACQGFGGAPLINTISKRSCLFEVTGIMSLRTACSIGTPAIFTLLSTYLEWIESIVWIHEYKMPSTTPRPSTTPFPSEMDDLFPDIFPTPVPKCPVGSLGQYPNCYQPTKERPLTTTPKPPKRTFARKCSEYNEVLYKTVITQDSNQKTIKKKFFSCDLAITPYIIDGSEAQAKEFPHMALIGYDDTSKKDMIAWSCGGTLISEKFVMTAAHCLDVSGLGPAKFVLLGELDFSTEDDDARPLKLRVAERKKHPEYKSKSKYNDIALLRLITAAIFNEYIRPACLPEHSAIDLVATATGWGLTEYHHQSSRLLKTDLSLSAHRECNALYSILKDSHIDQGILNETQFCAGRQFGQEDTCQGDSGGPLQVFHHEYFCMYSIVGITSFGLSCGTKVPVLSDGSCCV